MNQKEIKMNKIFNFEGVKSKLEIRFKDDDQAAPAELMIYDEIGDDPWNPGRGVTAKSVRDALKLIEPKDRELHVHVNSPGGFCDEASAIRSSFNEYQGRIVEIIDGVSASAATWCVPADETRAHKHSQIFVHDALGYCLGNTEDMRKAMESLDKVSDQIADIYQAKTGKSHKACRQMMKDETLMTGQEAYEAGFVDKIIEGRPVANFSTAQISNMKARLAGQRNSAPLAGNNQNKNKNVIMNKEKMIALLNKWAVTIPENATDEQLQNLIEQGPPQAPANVVPVPAPAQAPANVVPVPAPAQAMANVVKDYTSLLVKVNLLEENNRQAGRQIVESTINRLIGEDKLTEAERADALVLAADPANGKRYLDSLEKRMPATFGGAPLRNSLTVVDGNSFEEITKAAEADAQFRNQFFGAGAAKTQYMDKYEKNKLFQEIADSSIKMANILRKPGVKQKIIDNWQFRPKNTTTIDPGLQRQVIMMDMLEAFQPILIKLNAFSTVFSNVPREGTDTIDVPYYPLATDVSNSWNPAVGYAGTGGVVNARPIYIGGSGVTSGQAAPAGFAKDRKWLALTFSSYELRAQPYVNWAKLASQKGRKLAIDIFADIIGGVMTIANYGNAGLTLPVAAFDSNAIAKLTEIANGLNWPDTDRSLILDHTYWTPLLEDPAFKAYYAAGTTETLRKQEISEAYGFENIDKIPNFSTYAPGPNNQARTQAAQEYLYGFICWKYAMLVATAPIMPAEAVRALMVRYDLGTAPATGITLEYREFGNVTLDQETRVIECSYGAAPGVQTALSRITSQGN